MGPDKEQVMEWFSVWGVIFGLPTFVLSLVGLWVCGRHRHLTPWMWSLILGFVGLLSKTGFEVLTLLIALLEFGSGVQPGQLGGDLIGATMVVGLFSVVAGWVGEIALLLGIPFVIRELARQFQLWKELQSQPAATLSE
jgi:uncharacterized membrane protein YbhN (UPF0104 family)